MKRIFVFLTNLLVFISCLCQIDVPKLQKEVEQLRGLKFKNPIKVEYVSSEQIGQIIKQEIALQFAQNKLDDYEKSLKIFGLIPKKSSLKTLIETLYESQVAGIYNNKNKTMYILKTFNNEDIDPLFNIQATFNLQEVFLVHELNHALTDENFNYDKCLNLEKIENEDMQLASLSIAEGDATLVMIKYLSKKMSLDDSNMKNIFSLISDSSYFESFISEAFPLYIRESLVFPYQEGLNFMNSVSQGNTKKIDLLYKKPPKSTEEIIFPEKYLKGDDPPKEVKITQEELSQRKKNKKIWEGTWGYFGTEMILRSWGVEKESARTGATGWGGDRYEVYFDKNGKICAFWKTLWDNEIEAKEFEQIVLKKSKIQVKRISTTVCIDIKGD
jgi:hypothetical protein